MKAVFVVLALTTAATAHAVPKATLILKVGDINAEAIAKMQSGDGPAYRQHPGRMVRVQCIAGEDRRLTGCAPLEPWAAYFAGEVERKVRVRTGVIGPVQIDFRISGPRLAPRR